MRICVCICLKYIVSWIVVVVTELCEFLKYFYSYDVILGTSDKCNRAPYFRSDMSATFSQYEQVLSRRCLLYSGEGHTNLVRLSENFS